MAHPQLGQTPHQGGYSAVTLSDLRYTIAVAQHGSIRRAAGLLRITQSALSRRIRQTEEQLGVVLFERNSGGVCPTVTGAHFLRAAQRLLEQFDKIILTTRAVSRGDVGHLTVGFYSSLSGSRLRAILLAYTRAFPNVGVSAIEGSHSRLLTDLNNGDMDVAIVAGEAHGYEDGCLQLWSERIIVALPQDHPLAAHETVRWADLKDERILLSRWDPGPNIRNILTATLGSRDNRLTIITHDMSPENILCMVGVNSGLSLHCEASTSVAHPGIIYRAIQEDDSRSNLISYKACWRLRNDNPALAGFLDLLRTQS